MVGERLVVDARCGVIPWPVMLELHRKIQCSFLVRQLHGMAPSLTDVSLSYPSDSEIVHHIIDGHSEVGVVIRESVFHPLFVFLAPVGSIIAMSSSGVGHSEQHFDTPFCLHTRSNLIGCRVAHRLHVVRLPIVGETTLNLSRP